MALATLQEQDLIKIFRSRIQDLPLDSEQLHEQNLLKWLRARDGDVSKGEDMLRRHIQWRKTHQINSLLKFTPSPFITDTYMPKFCGYDKSGAPILLLTFGIWDLRPALARGEKENVVIYKDQCLEKIMMLMRLYERQRQYYQNVLSTSPSKITQFNCICDWSGFSIRYIMSKEAIEVILEAARSFEDNFPETLKAAYNVNCPKVFDVLFRLVKPFLSERTLSKILLYDSNEVKWKTDILKNLPIDQVPAKYGGTREKAWDLAELNLDLDQDGKFFSQVFHTSVPITPTTTETELEFKTIHLPSNGDRVTIPLIVAVHHSTLQWNFKVKGETGNVDFSIEFENRTKHLERRKVKMDKGEMLCEHAGNYWLNFSNANSAIMADPITLLYKFTLNNPESKLIHEY